MTKDEDGAINCSRHGWTSCLSASSMPRHRMRVDDEGRREKENERKRTGRAKPDNSMIVDIASSTSHKDGKGKSRIRQ